MRGAKKRSSPNRHRLGNSGCPFSLSCRTTLMETEERKVSLLGMIDHTNARDVYARVLYLRHLNQSEPITILVDSSGGIVSDCLALYDLLRGVQTPIRTHCTGTAGG